MGIFDDKVYEEMDFVSQLTEPVFNPLDKKLQQLPDEIIIDGFETIWPYIREGYGGPRSLQKDEILKTIIEKAGFGRVSWEDRRALLKCFDVEINVEDDATLDLEKKQLSGLTIRIFKIKDRFEEEEALKSLGKDGLDRMRSVVWQWRCVPVERVNEILEYMDLREARKFRSVRKKLIGLSNALANIMSTNQWRIRDIDLSNKVIDWIRLYLVNGNGAALVNFCKFKMLTHQSDNPIYSIEEEEV